MSYKYPHKVDIYQRTTTSDSMGGKSSAWSARLTNKYVRIYKKTIIGELDKKYTGETELFEYEIMGDFQVYNGERVKFGSTWYEIIQVYDAAGISQSHHYESKAKQI